ncbi:hypothetical protein [Ammoniphilus oxalaticus]|uniref:hypothetical protein n=1 Tax=Ammoniphilus oxalaticus TaxID=66863 RepID=UPI001FE71E9A|nr:hypothetical protein [Ammoniphilus oxalaticus]
MATICPLCNGLQLYELKCPSCNCSMNDIGRYMDFFDDYSPYLEIEGMKKSNGISDDQQSGRCPHVFDCPTCGHRHVKEIDELSKF